MAAGEEYVAAITALESDCGARRAFQERAMELAPAGGCIFDFGAGPGLDAKRYAERGFTVAAFETDPRMCASFTTRCRSDIHAGRVRLYQGEYRRFVDSFVPVIRREFEIEIVTANFAPLNLIEDLRELFASLHALTRPKARVLASVLNPWFVGDMRYGWWWANRLRYRKNGRFFVQGGAARIFRRSVRDFASQASPYFALDSATPARPEPKFSRWNRYGSFSFAAGRYLFLSFTKK